MTDILDKNIVLVLNRNSTPALGFKDGSSTAFDPYGRRPWQPGFGQESASHGKTLYRFQGEFARLFGPFQRGRSFHFSRLDNERNEDWFHQYHLSLEKKKS